MEQFSIEFFKEILIESLNISLFIFILMVLIELLEIKFHDKIKELITNKKTNQNFLSAVLGVIPGCGGTFVVDSLYMSGIVGMGGLLTALIATSGDEAFLLLAKNPRIALILFSVLFILGLVWWYLGDFLFKKYRIDICEKCKVKVHQHDHQRITLKHFSKKHVWEHIIKKHLIKLWLWLLLALVLIQSTESFWASLVNIDGSSWGLLIIAVIIWILPLSGPNILFMTLFLENKIPFSILLANSIVQDGHGLLPLLSYSLQDSVKAKLFNVLFGLLVGGLVLLLGW